VLTAVFRRALPDRTQADLLGAAVGDEARSRAAFRALLRAGDGRLGHLRAGDRELLTLLLRGVEAHDLDAPPALRSVLRAARLREEARSALVRAATARLLDELEARGGEPIVLGGLAVAEPLYGGLGMRHCGALEVLVAAEHLDAVPDVVDGLRVAARTTLLPEARDSPGHHAVLACAEATVVAGRPARVLAAPDLLLERLGAAGPHHDPSAWWAADAHLLVHRQPEVWGPATERARAAGAVLPVALRASWLHRALGTPGAEDAATSVRGVAWREAVPVLGRALRRRLPGGP
jgi:hypothetical protein